MTTPLFQCRLELPPSATIWDISATFGREGIHLHTLNPDEVNDHIRKVKAGDERLRPHHFLYRRNERYSLLKIGSIDHEGAIVLREQE